MSCIYVDGVSWRKWSRPHRELFSLIGPQMKGVFLEGKEGSLAFIHNAPFVKVSN